jgi:MFS family permease
MTALTGSRPQASAATRLPVMTLLVAIAGSASFGDAAAIVTLMLRLYRAANPSWAITALLFAVLGPSVLLAPFAARVLAWAGMSVTIAVTSACQAAAAAALVAVHGPWPTLALVVVIGAGLAVTQPALLEITPAVVGSDRLTLANSLTRSAGWSGWTVGPIAGGALCGAGLASAALLIEAASFLVAGACFIPLGRALTARAPASPGPPAPASRKRSVSIAATVRYILRERGLAGLIASVGVTNVCVAMLGVADVFFAREVLRTSSVGFALLSSAWFAGMIAGTLAAPRAEAWRPSLLVPTGIGISGAGIIAAATAGALPAAALAYGIAGIGFGLQATVVRSMIQRRAAGPLSSPVCGVWVATDMSAQLAGYLVGGVAVLAGARFTLAMAGAGLCSVSLVAFALAGRRRTPVRTQQPSQHYGGPA